MKEERVRIHTRISPETERKIAETMPLANCRSQNEFVEQALLFYCESLLAKSCTAVLPAALVDALQATVQNSENRTARLLFKLAVENNMMMNVLAMGLQVDPKDLERLRERCVREVKQTNGAISFKDAVERRQ